MDVEGVTAMWDLLKNVRWDLWMLKELQRCGNYKKNYYHSNI